MKRVAVVGLLLCLAACGYQLRQAQSLDAVFAHTRLQLDNASPLYRPLISELSHNGVVLVDSLAQAEVVIDIDQAQIEKQVQSIGTNNRVQEYRLDYTVVFSVREGDRIRVPKRTLNLSRDYAFDITQITGSQQEETLLREQLHADMARMITRIIGQSSRQ